MEARTAIKGGKILSYMREVNAKALKNKAKYWFICFAVFIYNGINSGAVRTLKGDYLYN